MLSRGCQRACYLLIISTAQGWPLPSAPRLQDPCSPYRPSRTAPPALCLLQRPSNTIYRSQACGCHSSRPHLHYSSVKCPESAFGLVSRSFRRSAQGSRLSTFAIRFIRELVSVVRRRYVLLCSGPTIVRYSGEIVVHPVRPRCWRA